MRLSVKILICLLLVGILPILMFSIVNFTEVESTIRADRLVSFNAVGDVVSSGISSTLNEGFRYIQFLAESPILTNADINRDLQQRELDLVFRYNYIFSDISFIDARGRIRASVHYSFRGSWISTSWFRKAMQGQTVVTSAHADLYPYDVVVSVLSPVSNVEGEIIGVIAGQMDMQLINEIVSAVTLGEASDIYVVDKDARVVASTADVELLEPIGILQLQNAIMDQSLDTHEVSFESTDYVLTITNMIGDSSVLLPSWSIIVMQDQQIAYAAYNQAQTAVLFALIICIIIVSVLSVILGRTISSPLRQLVQATSQIGDDHEPLALPRFTSDEIGELARAFEDAHKQVTEAKLKLLSANSRLEVQVTERTSDLKLINEELSLQKDRAEDANRAKSAFLANMSHELRTPLNHILGFTELVTEQKIGPLNQQQVEYLQDVLASSRHLLTLINDILDISKVEAGKTELHFDEILVPYLIEESMITFRPQAEEKRIKLETVYSNAGVSIEADEVKFRQIVYNLLSNAIKYTENGGKVIARITERPLTVEICVSDTGIGIKPEDIGRIFGAFEQVDQNLNRAQKGTGLGLALTKSLVELQHGTIRVESEGEGQGSQFCVVLPKVQPSRDKKTNSLTPAGGID